MTPKQPAPPAEPAPAVAPLSPGVRRHLGQNLRNLYGDVHAAPVTRRLETLIAQLEKTGR